MKISIAYSPDTDDAFMLEALVEKHISWECFDFEFVRDDIQKLNEQAFDETYDITAISAAAYTKIKDLYQLLEVGSSIGRNYGPHIVVKKDSPIQTIEDLTGASIAVPGRFTSAYYAATCILPDFAPKFLSFDKIEEALNSDQVGAGILIHELQLQCESKGLRSIGNLGDLWHKKFNLPLPLGANAINAP